METNVYYVRDLMRLILDFKDQIETADRKKLLILQMESIFSSFAYCDFEEDGTTEWTFHGMKIFEIKRPAVPHNLKMLIFGSIEPQRSKGNTLFGKIALDDEIAIDDIFNCSRNKKFPFTERNSPKRRIEKTKKIGLKTWIERIEFELEKEKKISKKRMPSVYDKFIKDTKTIMFEYQNGRENHIYF